MRTKSIPSKFPLMLQVGCCSSRWSREKRGQKNIHSAAPRPFHYVYLMKEEEGQDVLKYLFICTLAHIFSSQNYCNRESGLPFSPWYQQQNYKVAISDWESNISFLQKTVSSSHQTTSNGGGDTVQM